MISMRNSKEKEGGCKGEFCTHTHTHTRMQPLTCLTEVACEARVADAVVVRAIRKAFALRAAHGPAGAFSIAAAGSPHREAHLIRHLGVRREASQGQPYRR
jgi:hypothetical protein